MTKQERFQEVQGNLFPMLEKYVPVVDRVHGHHHPEFHEVRALFESMSQKVKAAGENHPDLQGELFRMREVTRNYTVPGDVCESYEAVFQMLEKIDEAYEA
jgi:regulator of cell morphogenesis and NO signaling